MKMFKNNFLHFSSLIIPKWDLLLRSLCFSVLCEFVAKFVGCLQGFEIPLFEVYKMEAIVNQMNEKLNYENMVRMYFT